MLMVPLPGNATGQDEGGHLTLTVPRSPSGLRDTQVKLTSRYFAGKFGFCRVAGGLGYEMDLEMISL